MTSTAAPTVASTITAPGEPRPVTPVGIAARELDLALALLDAGGDRDEVRERVAAARALVTGLDPYVARLTTPESGPLAALTMRTAEHDWRGGPGGLEQEMLSGHVEGQLLKMLVHSTSARAVLEIGMFTGYATLAMAEALPRGGTVIACEIDAEVAAMARESFAASPAGGRIEIRVGPAANTLLALAGEGRSFDLVFLDADKAGYLGYVQALLAHGLLAPNGLLCIDNTLMQGLPWTAPESTPNARAVRECNEALAADDRIEQVVLPVRDGMTLVRWARESS